jgi:hypothetical protein
MDKIINTRLLLHPVNWLVVWTVLLVAGFGWAIIHEHVSGQNIASTRT